MIARTTSGSIRQSVLLLLAGGVAALTAIAATALGAETAANDRALFRFDPLRYTPDAPEATLAPITEQEMKPGCIYSHFDETLHRRAWAVWQIDHQFSHALGEGTTQPSPNLDIRGTTEEKMEKLQQVNADLLRKLERQGGYVYFRLNKNNQWQLEPLADHATIYDAQTLRRWDWAYGKYVPISSAPFAYRWAVVNGRYAAIEEPQYLDTDYFCPFFGVR